MSTQIQRRRGTTAQHSTFTGVEGELTVDTTKDTVVVHDGATTGGRPLLREDQANLPTSVTNGISVPSANNVAISTNGTQRLLIEADGDINIDGGGVFYDATNNRLAIGTTTPGRLLQVSNTSADPFISILGAASNGGGLLFGDNASDASGQIRYQHSADAMYFATNATERVRIDSSGRLLVGTSTSIATANFLQVKASGSISSCGLLLASNYDPNVTDQGLAYLNFVNNSGNSFGQIGCTSDGNAGAADCPGRLVFSTTADGASSPTERMRIDSSGQIAVAGTGSAAAPVITKNDDLNTGIFFPAADTIAFAEGGSEAARITSNGDLLVGASSRSSKLVNKSIEADNYKGYFVSRYTTSVVNSSNSRTVTITFPTVGYSNDFVAMGTIEAGIQVQAGVSTGAGSPNVKYVKRVRDFITTSEDSYTSDSPPQQVWLNNTLDMVKGTGIDITFSVSGLVVTITFTNIHGTGQNQIGSVVLSSSVAPSSVVAT